MKQAVLGMLEENYDFELNSGSLNFSCDNIELSFVKNETREGSFTLTSNVSNETKGRIFSDMLRMQCQTQHFSGKSAEIQYSFDSTGMKPGERLEGEFHIISNFGEYTIPFCAIMEQESLSSSMGPIKNLFHFANLAQTNWEEALNLFYSADFISILKGNEAAYVDLYRGLSHHYGNQSNVEEFLVTVKKKSHVTYSLNTTQIHIDNPTETIRQEITLTRSGWGYIAINVQTTGDFLRLEKSDYTENDFLGNTLKIEFYIEDSCMFVGKNSGTVIIDDGYSTSTVIVTVEKGNKKMEESALYHQQELLHSLVTCYIDFRCKKKNTTTWAKESMHIVEQMNGTKEQNLIARLYQVQLLLVTERIGEAGWILEQVSSLAENSKLSSQTEAYYLYLTALCNKEDAAYADKITHRIKKMYHKESENWRIAWILLFLQEDLLKNPMRKWDFLEEQFDQGSFSPILYAEVLPLLAENPSLLMKLDKYELQLLHFIIRNQKLTKEIADRVLFLCSREREYSDRLFDILRQCYQRFPNRELLQGICSFLMKGNCIGKKYFPWYELGVLEELRLTRLYDFYILSIDLNYEEELPKMVMMYYAYQSNLPYERSAFLYAKVIRYKHKYPEIASAYAEHIDEFIREQLSKGRINEALYYLYRNVIGGYMLDAKLCADLAPQLFMHRITVLTENIKNVVVIHNKVVEEKVVPVVGNVAYVPIYSKEYRVFLETTAGNRIAREDAYRIQPLQYNQAIIDKVLENTQDRVGVLLNLCEGSRDDLSISEDNVFCFARLLRTEHITPEYQKEILVELVEFYFEHDYIHELDELLLVTNPNVLEREEIAEFMHILVARGMYDMAFSWIKTYGPECAKDKTLLRLCSRLLVRRDFEEDHALIEVATYVFRHGKYDQNILAYLVSYMFGTTKELKSLWFRAESFGVDNYVCLERVLIQMLFTGTFIKERMELYDKYAKNSGNAKIEKAFLSKCAYEYFVKDAPTDDSVFTSIEKIEDQGESTNRIIRLAWLKNTSEQPAESWNRERIIDYIGREVRGNHYFPFFCVFREIVPDISFMQDRSFIEYRGSTHSKVILHYVLEKKDGADEYSKEEMVNMYGGIFIKGFVLFYGETIQYYITEENGNCEQLTQSSMLQRADEQNHHNQSRFSMLNDLLLSMELQDYTTCEELMDEYAKKHYMVKRLFQPSEE